MAGFQDKVVFITGASSGIGAALAREFARRGADVVLAARREDRLTALADEVAKTGRSALAVRCDVTKDGDVEAAVQAAVLRFGRVDVVVANAGFGVAGKFERLTLDDYRRQFETNVFGLLRTAKAGLEELKKTRGVLVLIGSVSSYISTPAGSPYAMSKFAVRAFAEALDGELRPKGVAVTLICPGFIESEIRLIDNRGVLHPDAKDKVPSWLVMPTTTAARDIVRAVAGRRRKAIITGHGKALVLASRLVPGLLGWATRRGVKEGRKEPKGQ